MIKSKQDFCDISVYSNMHIKLLKYICLCFVDFHLFFVAFLNFCKPVKSTIIKYVIRINIKYSVCLYILYFLWIW